MRVYCIVGRYIKRLLLATLLHWYVLVIVRSQTFLVLVLRNLSSAPLSTLIVVSLLRTTRIFILYPRVLTCIRGMTSQNSSYCGDDLPVGHSYNIIYAYIYAYYTAISCTRYYYIIYKMLYAPFNGRAGSVYTSMAKSGGNRPGNFNETETIVVVVALFIRIRTTILVVCVYRECKRYSEREGREGE